MDEWAVMFTALSRFLPMGLVLLGVGYLAYRLFNWMAERW